MTVRLLTFFVLSYLHKDSEALAIHEFVSECFLLAVGKLVNSLILNQVTIAARQISRRGLATF